MTLTPKKNKIKKSAAYGKIFLLSVFCYSLLYSQVRATDDDATVRKLMDEPLRYRKINIDGVIFKRLDPTTYLVQDGTGVIRVSIPPNLMPVSGFFPKNHIELNGVMDVKWNNVIEVDVKSLTFSF